MGIYNAIVFSSLSAVKHPVETHFTKGKICFSGNLLPKNMFFCVDVYPLDFPPTVPLKSNKCSPRLAASEDRDIPGTRDGDDAPLSAYANLRGSLVTRLSRLGKFLILKMRLHRSYLILTSFLGSCNSEELACASVMLGSNLT